MATVTHTRTHVYVEFANPNLFCDKCDDPVPAWHDRDVCGCDDNRWWWNVPCRHTASIRSACPTWSPVDGCQCPPNLAHPNP